MTGGSFDPHPDQPINPVCNRVSVTFPAPPEAQALVIEFDAGTRIAFRLPEGLGHADIPHRGFRFPFKASMSADASRLADRLMAASLPSFTATSGSRSAQPNRTGAR